MSLLAVSLMGLLTTRSVAQTNDPTEPLTRLAGSLRFYTVDGASEPARQGETARVNFGADGLLRHLAAPPGHAFLPERAVPGKPEQTAAIFLQENKALFGLASSNSDVVPLLTRQLSRRTYVRLQQTYAGVPVFAGQAAVQLNAASGVEFMSADLALEVNELDAQLLWTTPAVSDRQVASIVSAQVAVETPGIAFTTTPPHLMIYAPSVLGEDGPVQLVWEVKVDSEQEPELNERWLVDAKTGAVARRYALTHSALNRQIRDSSNTTAWPGTLVRSEGNPATGTVDVDNAYAFLGNTYIYYLNNHGRDSYNDGGATINATVRYCPSVESCPWSNAQWTGSRIRFGNGYTTDDVTAHEFTHAVTDFTSGLVYANASGAMNESFSDVFGEFVDLTNGAGDDSAAVRWDMGEDLPNGRLRSMDDPPARGDPDRVGSSLYVPATNDPKKSNDYGGVHVNSGVNNKLCFLLTDGATFNGQTVTGMGISQVADLYYEANANLLTSGADWNDLFEALRQAAVNLGWNVDDRNNLYRACRAVEIASPDNLYVDGSSNCFIKNGRQTCNFIFGGPFKTVIQGVSAAQPGDRLYIRGGSYNEALTFREITTVRSYDGTAVIGD
jgi:Zn-dependent metalloprotease